MTAPAPSQRITLINAISIAMLAAFIEQITHEVTHGVAAMIVGKDWLLLNLFAVYSEWPGEPSNTGDGIVAASAALFNIVCGGVAVMLFRAKRFADKPVWRIFWMYFAGFSILGGFGYLMVDPLFYSPDKPTIGDWKKIVALLGGTWGVRLPIIAVGAAGTLFAFFWLPWAVMRLGDGSIDRPARVRRARTLLLIPYIAVCTLATILAIWHPRGGDGLFLIILKYWMGYSAMFWAFMIAGYWANHDQPIADATPLPARVATAWVIAAAVIVIVSAAVLLPTLELASR